MHAWSITLTPAALHIDPSTNRYSNHLASYLCPHMFFFIKGDFFLRITQYNVAHNNLVKSRT